MKHLEDAFKQNKIEQPKSPSTFKHKNKLQYDKWTLDPDYIQKCPEEVRHKLVMAVSSQLKKTFQCEKYLEEEAFRQLIKDLTSLFTHSSSELQKLSKIQQILQDISDSFEGEYKNYLKQFQSLLDAKIRKLKKKEKKSQLVEYQRLAAKQPHIKRKNQVYYINQDEKLGVKYPKKLLKKESLLNESKKSFGTMNSGGSNQNESGGSCNNQSGSGSKSGESKALAVLLANIDLQQQKKGKIKQKQKQKYEFTSILSATVSIRNRANNSRLSAINLNTKQQNKSHILQSKDKNLQTQDKDEAFIFHRPKHNKHKH